uniref:Anoctamin n=1 Tax=Eptatretus burgeri TaxID=7764 RepID=A0A8C4QW29_EPTBU
MSQILNQVVESLLPFWLRKRKNQRFRHVGNALRVATSCRVKGSPDPQDSDAMQSLRRQISIEGKMDIYLLAFEAMGLMSIMTNCALVAMSPDVHELFGQTDVSVNYVMAFVSLEHILLVLWFVLHFVLPDRPSQVRNGLARLEFQSRLALKQQHEEMESLLLKDILKITHKKPL